MQYPLYDRSGVDDDDAPMLTIPAPVPLVEEPGEILVCQAGSCRRAGSEAVLLEIEELAKGLRCSVRSSGCLGACGAAPNAVVVRKRGRDELRTRLDDVEKCSAVVRAATGRTPSLDDPALRQRLTAARRLRVRQQALGEGKWNVAMAGMAEQIAAAASGDDRLELQFELAKLCVSAAQWEQALEHLAAVELKVGRHPQLTLERSKALGKLGRAAELEALLANLGRASSTTVSAVKSALKEAASVAANGVEQPRRVEGYAVWTLAGVTPVSRHSVVFHLTSSDRKRGTPYTRGRGRTMWHKTWHTTLLAHVGPNAEGPLAWIERDYTPVSTWTDWEHGSCDILIKIYRAGAATAWLHKQAIGSQLLLSQPRKTLDVPSLATDGSRLSSEFRLHRSVLLILGGTGIVAAPQVLYHTDPATSFGTSATGYQKPPLTSP
eukprot:7382335-Prymnesium_polylepis.1